MRRLAIVAALVALTAAGGVGCGSSSTDDTDDRATKAGSETSSADTDSVNATLALADEKARPRELPEGWSRAQDGSWVGPEEDGFARSVSVLSFALDSDEDTTAEDLGKRGKRQLESFLLDADVREERRQKVLGHPGYLLEYTGRMDTDPNPLYWISQYTVVGSRGYSITGTMRATDVEQQRSEVLSVMQSIDLND